jgi:class 3 adenylate cyclase
VRNWPLRVQILLASSAILAALIVATLLYVGYQANRFVGARLTADLQRSQEQIVADQAERFATLGVLAQLMASFPELRALLATDAATIRDFLLDYQKRTGRSELLVVLDPAGRVVARTDAPTPLPIPDVEARWLRPALAGRPAVGFLETDTGAYEAALAPAEAGGTVFGFLMVGARIDDGLARRLRDVSRDEVAILGSSGVLGSTIETRRLPWSSKADWDAFAGRRSGVLDVDVSGERFAVAEAAVAPAGAITFLGLQSRDRALAPYRRIQLGLLLLGALGVLAGVAASAVLARSVTAPVGTLVGATTRVAAGDFDITLPVQRGDELGELARAFNAMTRGLRERADMQKFVSQSTVDMIQATAGRRASAGERRTLTILFSDLRGFTAWAEHRPPEAVVQMLNRCLSVQAERVKKFRGDVDKYVGDCVVALFTGEDMALDAIRCAVEIHRALAAESASVEGGLPRAGIGIATGEVVLGSIGGEARLDYTAIGVPVNLASRLCSLAGVDEVLLTEPTYRLVRDLVAAERLEPARVKGVQDEITVYRMRVGPAGA